MTESTFYKSLNSQLDDVEHQARNGMPNPAKHGIDIISEELERDKEFTEDLFLQGELDKIKSRMDQLRSIINHN